MEFDNKSGLYTFEIDGIIFEWDEEPQGDYEKETKAFAANYRKHLPQIIDFMLPDLKDMYGEIEADTVEEKLGKPIIEIEQGRVTYCEQTFDYEHIFSFEFLDDKFEDLQYFAVDG